MAGRTGSKRACPFLFNGGGPPEFMMNAPVTLIFGSGWPRRASTAGPAADRRAICVYKSMKRSWLLS